MSTLASAIYEFIEVAASSLRETKRSEDRRLYHEDLALAAIWLTELNAGASEADVATKILAPEMQRHYFDVWKDGIEGERESRAFAKLVVVAEAKRGE